MKVITSGILIMIFIILAIHLLIYIISFIYKLYTLIKHLIDNWELYKLIYGKNKDNN